MSRSLIGGVVGGVIGFIVGGGPTGAYYGFTIGSTIGGIADRNAQRINRQGPRLGDQTVQASAYGGPIPRLYGTDRLAGNVEYLSARREVTTTTSERQGKGGPKVTTTSYSYFYDAVISFVDCPDMPITGVRRIWANGKLIYTNAADAGADSVIASANVARAIRVLPGDETQLPDPMLEAVYGVGNVPAFRGVACVVFEDFCVDDFYGVFPQIECEIVKVGPVTFAEVFGAMAYAPDLGTGLPARYSVSSVNGNGDSQLVFKEDALNSPSSAPYKVICAYQLDMEQAAKTVQQPVSEQYYIFATLQGISDVDAICFREVDPILLQDSRFNRLVNGGGGTIGRFNMGPIPAYASARFAKFGSRVIISGESGQLHEQTGSLAGNYARVFDLQSQNVIAEFDISPSPYIFLFVALTPSFAWAFWYDAVAEVTRLRIHDARSGVYIGDRVVPARLSQVQFWRVQQNDDDTLTVLTQDALAPTCWLMAVLQQDATATVIASQPGPAGSYIGPTGFDAPIRVLGRTAIGVQLNAPGSIGGVGFRQFLIRFEALGSTGVPLSDIVDAECALAGLQPADIDTSELTDTVIGYKLTRNGGVRGGIEPLQSAFFFDQVESGYQLKFPKRGKPPVLTIAYSELGAAETEDDESDPLPSTRAPRLELPTQLAITYINPASDYQTGTEISRRLTTPGQASATIEVPVVLTADKAAQIADALMYEAHTASTSRAVSLLRRYCALEPGDVINLTDAAGNLLPSRINAIEYAGPVLKLDTASADATVWTQTTTGAAGSNSQTSVTQAPLTIATFLDIPILRDEDNDAGCYVKLRPTAAAGWSGATLFRIAADGNRTEVGTVNSVPAVGIATTVLPAAGTALVDEASTVTVDLSTGEAESITDAALVEGLQGAWLIGNEIIQVRDATFVSGTTWVLSGLIRGARGTEWAVGTHVAGERAVALDAAGMLRVPLTAADIGQEVTYQAVSIGRTLPTAQPLVFTNTALGLKPFAPVNLRGARAATDWTLSWDRRSRLRYSNPPTGDIPLGEASELYDVLIYSDATFTSVVRTYAGVTSASAFYSAADQTADFGAVRTTLYIGVFQISAVVGRGYELRGTLIG